MKTIKITIPGKPVAKGTGRAIINKKTQHLAIMNPVNTNEYINWVRICSLKVKPEIPFDEPLMAKIDVFLQKPKKPKYSLPATRPDIDNFCKSIFDGMTGIIFRDDSLVVNLCITKIYSSDPRVEVRISTILEEK